MNGRKVDSSDLEMLEKYLTEKYDENFKIIDYYFYDNGEYGINAGPHYGFELGTIDGLDIFASLDYWKLTEENLHHIKLNITNVDKANKLKKFVEESTGINCKVVQFREIYEKDYELFSISFDNYNGHLYGIIDNDKEIETAYDFFSDGKLNTTIEKNNINLNDSFINVLQLIKRRN